MAFCSVDNGLFSYTRLGRAYPPFPDSGYHIDEDARENLVLVT
jgi:hypothetical protein